jgi:hypothetical protein
MRAWLSPQTGTGGFVTQPLDPPIETAPDDWADPEVPEFQTEITLRSPLGPTHPPSNGWQRPVTSAPNWDTDPIWVVIDVDATDAPAGTLDMGDPSTPGWASTLLTRNQKLQLQSRLGGRNQFWSQDRTRGGIIKLMAGVNKIGFRIRNAARQQRVIDESLVDD